MVCPKEAAIVKQIFPWYLSGLGQTAIANRLYEMGIASPAGMTRWSPASVGSLLHSEKMRGNLLHQHTYAIDAISKKQVLNHGELPKYLVRNTHEGIIDDATLDMVQDEFARRCRIGGLNEYAGLAFRKKIVCGYCGYRFIHTRASRKSCIKSIWRCGGHDKRSHVWNLCKARDIPEATLFKVTCEVLGIDEFDPDEFERQVKEIYVPAQHSLTFVMRNGEKITKTWEPNKQGLREKGLPDQDTLPPLPRPSVIPAVHSKLSDEE